MKIEPKTVAQQWFPALLRSSGNVIAVHKIDDLSMFRDVACLMHLQKKQKETEAEKIKKNK